MRSSTNLISAASLIAALLVSYQSTAQVFDVGTNAFNIGLGVGGRYSYYTTTGKYATSPALVLAYDRGVTKLGPGVLGIGGVIGYQTVKYEYDYSTFYYSYHQDRRWTNILIGARGTWHWNDWHGNSKLDLYAGALVGYNIGTYTSKSTRTSNGVTTEWDDGYNSSSSFFRHGLFVGARYLFTEKFGVYGEVGYGVSYLNGGITFVL